jgi:radical SAM superfamily enzyme YgiQ (UPF0313 family)
MKRVLFVQLPPPRFRFEEPPSNIPLAAGFLVSALKSQKIDRVEFSILEPDVQDVLADKGLVEKIIEKDPDIVALTLYVWNVQRSLYLASLLRRALPELRIVAGGPEVTHDNDWVLNHPTLDYGVFGEGESRIGPLLVALLSGGTLGDIPEIFYRAQEKLCINSDQASPLDLGSYMYPYLDGQIEPTWDGTLFIETVRGCPFKCRYCYYHKAFTTIRKHSEKSIQAVLDMAYRSDSPIRELYLMDPTFNAQDGYKKLLRSLIQRRSTHDVTLHTELRADLLKPDDVQLLKDAGLKSAEVGLQTTNEKTLRFAGRTGKPEQIARGVAYLKEAGIEVTTGIILGLPMDTPESFSRTVKWLKRTGSYSVVHPFVLSILPGTDFRASSKAINLNYDPRPPYYVIETPTFPREAFQQALRECEDVLDMELDYIPPPSLVETGLDVHTRPMDTSYVSKWIINPENESTIRNIFQLVAGKATDPFTFWFKGSSIYPAERIIDWTIHEFSLMNPHGIVRVVLEFNEPPSVSFIEQTLYRSSDANLYINRTYEPLYGENVIVSLDFTIILPDPGSPDERKSICDEYTGIASIVWDCVNPLEQVFNQELGPVLISWSRKDLERHRDRLFQDLGEVYKDREEEVLFRDFVMQQKWDLSRSEKKLLRPLPERILSTGIW